MQPGQEGARWPWQPGRRGAACLHFQTWAPHEGARSPAGWAPARSGHPGTLARAPREGARPGRPPPSALWAEPGRGRAVPSLPLTRPARPAAARAGAAPLPPAFPPPSPPPPPPPSPSHPLSHNRFRLARVPRKEERRGGKTNFPGGGREREGGAPRGGQAPQLHVATAAAGLGRGRGRRPPGQRLAGPIAQYRGGPGPAGINSARPDCRRERGRGRPSIRPARPGHRAPRCARSPRTQVTG